MARHNDLGKKGEEIAANFLKKWSKYFTKKLAFYKSEIDIIFLDENILVLAEVKTRSTSAHGNPEEFISDKKLSLYLDVAEEYLKENKMDNEIRFDIVSIVYYSEKPIIKYIKDAF